MIHDPRNQNVIDLAAYRDMIDSDYEDYIEAPVSRRARWLNAAESTMLALVFVAAVLALCVAFVLSPLFALVAAFWRAK
jgi:hypothetical protein